MSIPQTSALDPRMYEPAIERCIEDGYSKDQYYKELVSEVSWSSVSPNYKSGVKSMNFIPIREARPRGEEEPLQFDRVQRAYLVESEYTEYGLAVSTSRKALADELHGVLKAAHEGLGASVTLLKNKQVGAFYDNALTTTYITGPDGVALASSAHPHPNSAVTTTWTNVIPTNGALSYALLQEALVVGLRMTNYNGDPQPMWSLGDTLTLVVQPEDVLMATNLINTLKEPGSDRNDTNVLKQFKWNVIANPFLAGTGNSNVRRWFVMKPDKGLELVEREGLSRSTYTENGNKALVTDVLTRYGFHPRDFKYFVMGGF